MNHYTNGIRETVRVPVELEPAEAKAFTDLYDAMFQRPSHPDDHLQRGLKRIALAWKMELGDMSDAPSSVSQATEKCPGSAQTLRGVTKELTLDE